MTPEIICVPLIFTFDSDFDPFPIPNQNIQFKRSQIIPLKMHLNRAQFTSLKWGVQRVAADADMGSTECPQTLGLCV